VAISGNISDWRPTIEVPFWRYMEMFCGVCLAVLQVGCTCFLYMKCLCEVYICSHLVEVLSRDSNRVHSMDGLSK
jgi:hypothetical protein